MELGMAIGELWSIVFRHSPFVICPLSFDPPLKEQGSGTGGQRLRTENQEPTTRDKRLRPKDQETRDNGQPMLFRGFTLLETMIALSVVLILASFAIPAYYLAIQRAREAVLRQDLYTLRSLIDEFAVDKQRPPASLQELVEAGYLRGGIPVDPITDSSESWQVDVEDVPSGADDMQSGVVDLHSGSEDNSLDGTSYSSW